MDRNSWDGEACKEEGTSTAAPSRCFSKAITSPGEAALPALVPIWPVAANGAPLVFAESVAVASASPDVADVGSGEEEDGSAAGADRGEALPSERSVSESHKGDAAAASPGGAEAPAEDDAQEGAEVAAAAAVVEAVVEADVEEVEGMTSDEDDLGLDVACGFGLGVPEGLRAASAVEPFVAARFEAVTGGGAEA